MKTIHKNSKIQISQIIINTFVLHNATANVHYFALTNFSQLLVNHSLQQDYIMHSAQAFMRFNLRQSYHNYTISPHRS